MTVTSVLTKITKTIKVKQLFIVAVKTALEEDFVNMHLTEC